MTAFCRVGGLRHFHKRGGTFVKTEGEKLYEITIYVMEG